MCGQDSHLRKSFLTFCFPIFLGLQIMRKFLRDRFVLSATFPDEMIHLGDMLNNSITAKGTLLEMSKRSEDYTDLINLELLNSSEINYSKTCLQVPLPPFKRKALDGVEMENLKAVYEFMYPNDKVRHISHFYQSFKCLFYAGSYYHADHKNNSSASVVSAKWLDESKRPAILRGFLRHDIVIEKSNGKVQKITHILADVQWFAKYHRDNFYAHPVEVWSRDFEQYSSFSFMPVSRIQEKCIVVEATFKRGSIKENINVIIPLLSAITI